MKIRLSYDSLISALGILILVRQHLCIMVCRLFGPKPLSGSIWPLETNFNEVEIKPLGAIICTGASLLLIRHIGTNFIEFNQNVIILIPENEFENVICNMAAIPSLPQCVIVRRAGLLLSQQDFEWRWSVPLFQCLTVLEFSFILFDLCLLITFFNFIMNYVLIVTFWIFTYHKIWILSIMFCFIWSYWIIYFLACL